MLTFWVYWVYEGCLELPAIKLQKGSGRGRKGVGEGEGSQGDKQGWKPWEGKERPEAESAAGRGLGEVGRDPSWARTGLYWRAPPSPGPLSAAELGPFAPPRATVPISPHPQLQPVRPPGGSGSRWDAVLCPPLSAASAGDLQPASLSGGRGTPGRVARQAGWGGRVLLEVAFAGGEETGPSELP